MGRFSIALVAMVLFATSAFAHATLLRASPADGSVLSAAPSTMTLTFNETVAPLIMRLIKADGAAIDLQDVATEGGSVAIKLPTIGNGTQALSFRVVSADGHPVGGTIVFSVGAPSGQA